MSAYVYSIIPYKSGFIFDTNEPYSFAWGFVPQEIESIESEFTDSNRFGKHGDGASETLCARVQ